MRVKLSEDRKCLVIEAQDGAEQQLIDKLTKFFKSLSEPGLHQAELTLTALPVGPIDFQEGETRH